MTSLTNSDTAFLKACGTGIPYSLYRGPYWAPVALLAKSAKLDPQALQNTLDRLVDFGLIELSKSGMQQCTVTDAGLHWGKAHERLVGRVVLNDVF